VTTLDHRRFLEPAASFRPFRGTDLFARIGGQETVDQLVDRLYDRFLEDEALRPLFTGDLPAERARQKLFFAEWLGGPAAYSAFAWGGLAQRHAELPITRALAGRWLGHFRRSLEAVVASEEARASILDRIQALALALPNHVRVGEGETLRAGCLPAHHPLNAAAELARRGDRERLCELRAREPTLLADPLHAAAFLHAAVSAGRLELVRWLLDQGVDVDKPWWLPIGAAGVAFERVLFVTPLCAARMRRRQSVLALLEQRGAKEDVFTGALLGDDVQVSRLLAADRSLAQAPDPALDVLEVTAIHHAVAAGRARVFDLLLDHAEPPLHGAERALRGAAAAGSRAMVARLLAAGADARAMGPGRWVLNVEVAPLLAAAGATAGGSGAWIGASCTGNQGRKDDPDYVRALLRHGAHVDDRRAGTEATALHHAARAGFLRTIEVLLAHGADPAARDAAGETPLNWLARASKSVDRDAVRRLLAPHLC
jgi:truncated hemoglobin YjbI/ankyrin repeat protein